MTMALGIWLITLVFFLTHQMEEVVYSVGAWRESHPRPGWRRWTTWLSRSPLASQNLRIRAVTVAGQMVGVILLGVATSGSLLATQVAASVLITGLMLAFVMRIAASVLTRSAMPGLATSILPGLPGAVMLLIYIWTR
jgi:Protein of unknown function with HXXEE motif